MIADHFGARPEQIQRWRRSGVDVDQADWLASAVDLHPSIVWPDW